MTAEPANELLGGLMLYPDLVDSVDLAPDDFEHPSHQAVFAAMVHLRDAGRLPDITALVDVLGADWRTRLMTLQGLGSTRHIGQRVEEVKLAAAGRRAAAIGDELVQELRAGAPVAETIERAQNRLSLVELPDMEPDRLYRCDEFVTDVTEQPWVIPGLLRRGWRVLIVGPEGLGKSMIVQQVAILAGRGVHPFTAERIPVTRSLIIDLENPPDVVDSRLKRLDAAKGTEAWLWHRDDGLDLRTRRHRSQLEAVLAKVRPEIVTLGPLYKAFNRGSSESYEQAAAQLQMTLDDLRVRFGFALLIEHHAGHGSGGVRDMRPEGSSLWLRWPEIGIKLVPPDAEDRSRVELKRFRYDRVENAWPKGLSWGRGVPWVQS